MLTLEYIVGCVVLIEKKSIESCIEISAQTFCVNHIRNCTKLNEGGSLPELIVVSLARNDKNCKLEEELLGQGIAS